ncbi:hypothetical protein DTO166G4_3497 [Paecilomyces variotii]|nr:hypothetical protein DTO166G4_3497 [Paecilomyces variotii]KAJ9238415.1 hypothetical protein DTO166G5_2963 [Paecilomyces variotii]KAJ9270272.1 hypothetical protein DTO212C5_3766 [Paecilomyces variotii]KAJ9297436.1 hypothetical protein DTO217A2_8643 [Paecilomyces variotii]KAJ9394178.1 hypothetical protein DTO282F9_8895 [Paecilomyces variotii]
MARWPSRGPEPFISTITSAILRDQGSAIVQFPTPLIVIAHRASHRSYRFSSFSNLPRRIEKMARQPSFESERPIMAARNSQRFSTLSGSPSLAYSDRTLPSGDPKMADIKELSDGLERLENKPLTQQRFVPTEEKAANLNKLALGAKVERSLGRRMTNQDAVMRKPLLNEKQI